MGYDLFWKNDPDTERDARLEAAAERMRQRWDAGEFADDLQYFSAVSDAIFRAAEAGGSYYRASIHVGHALFQELHRQGACDLANAIDWESGVSQHEIDPDLILSGLDGVSDEPTCPPDHEYTHPWSRPSPVRAGRSGLPAVPSPVRRPTGGAGSGRRSSRSCVAARVRAAASSSVERSNRVQESLVSAGPGGPTKTPLESASVR